MNDPLKQFAALIFVSALAAASAVSSSAASINADDIAAIPELKSVCVEDIPELKAETAAPITAVPALTADAQTVDIEFFRDFKNVIVLSDIPEMNISWDFKSYKSEAYSSSVQTADTPETNDIPETQDTPETNDIPESQDTPETNDTPDEPEFTETLSPLENAPEEQKIKFFGDVDLDKSITSSDALAALRIPFTGTATPLEREVADVDFDGVNTSADALEILRNASELSDSLTKSTALEDVKWFTDSEGSIYAFIAGGHDTAFIANIDGYACGFDEYSKLITGEAEVNGEKYVFTENGVLVNGWQKTDEGLKLYANGTAAEGWTTVYEQTFYFNSENNTAATGWNDIDGKHCFFDENGTAAEGFADIEGKTYYFDNTLDNKTGLIEVNGRHYMMLEEGGMAHGFTEVNGKLYCFTEDGYAASGWTSYDGKVYYFISETELASGVYNVNGEDYKFNADGTFETGFVYTGKGTLYKDENGFEEHGFIVIGGNTYYFGSDGIMAVGSVKIDGSTYVFDENGVMTTGWYYKDDLRAYLLDGRGAVGAHTIDGTEYFFEDDGTIRTGFFKKNGALYFKNNNGVNQTGFIEDNGDTYYFGADGKAVTDFQTIDGNLYCFGDDYKMLRNTSRGLYRITENGVCVKLTTVDSQTAKYKADEIIELVGKDANALCHYVHNHMSYYFINEPVVYSDPYSADWGRIAAFGMNRGYGACYNYSAFLGVLLQRAGFTSRIIVGTGYYDSLHSFNQLYLNGEWVTYDALYDTCAASNSYMRSLGYTYEHFIDYTF